MTNSDLEVSLEEILKRIEEIGSSLLFSETWFEIEILNFTEGVEVDGLTPGTNTDQAEDEDSDPEIRELEGERSKCSKHACLNNSLRIL